MDIDQNKIRRLDFSLLLVFDELVRHQRTTVVAERLGLSQSAISHALARLRDLFEEPLFTRRPDGLTPTRRALELAPVVRDLLQQAQAVIGGAERFDPAASTRLFRLAANDLVATLLGAPLLARLASEAPSTRLAIRFAVGAEALDALRRDELDLAIGRFYDLPKGFETTELIQEEFVVIARQGHPAINGAIDLATFCCLDHVLVSFSGRLTGVVDEALARLGLSRQVRASTPMFLSAFAAVADSDLVATAPARLARRLAPRFGLQVLAPPLTIEPFPISLVRAQSARPDPGLDWLADQVRGLAQTMA